MGVTKRSAKRSAAKAQAPDGNPANSKSVRKAVFESTKKKEVGVSDLTLISEISEKAINDNLRKRFENDEIYTYIGHVLISVNPFRDLGIYTNEALRSYRGKNRLEMPPHVFGIAESAYHHMNSYKESQCIIISGESGAGKTEAAKQIMQYIANVSGGASSSIQEIKEMVLATNPLLESFGCAKTLRNNNSSRHGKYLEIQFNAQGEPVGANITNYLLEKGRIVSQILSERNFHIFYQYTKNAPKQYRESYGVQAPESYIYTSQSKCYDAAGIDDNANFEETLQAMRTIGLSQGEQDEIFRMLAIILWLGNVHFVENNDGNAKIADDSVPNFVAYLMDVDATAVEKALTSRIVETQRGGRRGSVYEVPLNPTQATAVRDALSKAIYDKLFEWIVAHVNKSLRTRGSSAYTVGILDIYGFEIFENNSFEQVCINYVNEKLQQIFIELTLKTEQEDYVREKIKWTPIDYFNNKVVCDLIEEKRPPGIFATLNDACATAHADPSAADQSFVQKLSMLSSNPHFQNRQGHFIIKHYAGDVTYTVDGMTDKNKDSLLKDLLDLIAQSGNHFLNGLFPDQVDRDSKKRPPTASDKIKSSANDLVQTLSQASPSYIRTIKPNSNKSPREYDEKAVLHQVKYLGLKENVRIRRAGFAYRQTFQKFVERFYLLSHKTSYAGDYIWRGDYRSAAEQILKDTGIPKQEYQMGVSKAFIKTPETLFALEHMRDRYWHNMAARIQRAWRRYLKYKAACAIKIQRMWRRLRGGLDYIQIRDYGHEVLAGRKGRRRFSLLGSRRFLGDYLGVGMQGGPGEIVRGATAIRKDETIEFSARCELLLSKLGRSRQTNKAVYVVVSMLVNKQLNVSTERTISLATIKIEYSKKPGKISTVKFVLDNNIARDDLYKSGTVHVGPGELPSSISRPTPQKKAGMAAAKPSLPHAVGSHGAYRPTQANGNSTGAKTASAKRQVAPQPLAVPKANADPSYSASPASVSRAAPPPQPPPIVAAREKPAEPIYRVLYDFQGQSQSELSVKKEDIILITRKEGAGWWLAKHPMGGEGWVPSSYITEEQPAAPKARAPPAPVAQPAAAPRNSVHAQWVTSKSQQLAARPISSKPAPPAPPKTRQSNVRNKPPPPPVPPSTSGRSTPVTDGRASTASIQNLAEMVMVSVAAC